MKTLCILPLMLLWSTAAVAQQAAAPVVPAGAALEAPAAPVDAAANAAAGAVEEEDEDWRDTSAYPFYALADVALRLQLVSQAMQLRDWCANGAVSDDFVRDRLARFSALSGRRETCRSLLDY